MNDLRDNTFFAVLHLQLGAAEITVDARPSDAIALALRVGAPIFVDEAVVAKAQMSEGNKEPEAAAGRPEDPDKVKEWPSSPATSWSAAKIPGRRPSSGCASLSSRTTTCRSAEGATSVETLRAGLAGGHQTFAPPRGTPLTRPASFATPIPAPTTRASRYPYPARRASRAWPGGLADLVHVQHPFLLGVTGRRLARRLGVALVFTYHTLPEVRALRAAAGAAGRHPRRAAGLSLRRPRRPRGRALQRHR